MCLIGEIARFQSKIRILKWLPNPQSHKGDIYETFVANNPNIAHFKNIIFVWVEKPDSREGQVEK